MRLLCPLPAGNRPRSRLMQLVKFLLTHLLSSPVPSTWCFWFCMLLQPQGQSGIICWTGQASDWTGGVLVCLLPEKWLNVSCESPSVKVIFPSLLEVVMLLGIFSSVCVFKWLSRCWVPQDSSKIFIIFIVLWQQQTQALVMEGMEQSEGGLGVICLSLGPLLNVSTITEQVYCQPRTVKVWENNDEKPPSLHNSKCCMNPQCVVKGLDHFKK